MQFRTFAELCSGRPDFSGGGIDAQGDLPIAIRQSRRLYLSEPSESVREHHAGLHSFRNMSRMEARRRKASALRVRFSQSLASLRQRPSQAKVRSTIQRLGKTTKPLT